MSFAVPLPLLGRDILTCTVYSGAASPTTGTITWATGVDISTAGSGGTAAYKGFTISPSFSKVDVTPSDAAIRTQLNEVADYSFTINEIQSATGATALSGIVSSGAEYIKVVISYRKRGASTGTVYRGAMGSINSHSLPHDTGLNVASITADCIGAGFFDGASSIPTAFQ